MLARRRPLLDPHPGQQQRAERDDAADHGRADERRLRTPIAALTGPVSANDTGSSPIEISQSRLDTRPSSAAGTWRCLAVAHTIVPAVSSALNARLASMSCQTAVASP